MKRYPVATVREYISFGLETWTPLLKLFAWSFEAACNKYW